MKLLTLAAVAAMTAGVSAQQLTTISPFASNNGGGPGGGVYFDLTAAVDLAITDFSINVTGTGSTCDVYTIRGGSFAGNESIMGNWTLETSGTTALVNGLDQETNYALASPLMLTAGQQTAIAIILDAATAHSYTNGTGTNENWSNAELAFAAGSATNTPFDITVFNPRVCNIVINYVPGMGFASAQAFGDGCGADPNPATLAEEFAGGAFDYAAGTGYTLGWDPASMGYTFTNGASAIVAPTGANPLTLGDDQTIPVTLPAAIPSQFGMITDIFVCSNGYIAFESTTVADFTPTFAELLNGFGRVCPLWTDLDPTAAGTVDAEADGAGVFHVTWTGVPDWGTANPNTFQCSFHPNGDIEVKFDALTAGGPTITGVTAGNGATGMSTDLSAIVGTVTQGTGRGDVVLSASDRPFLGNSFDLVISNFPDNGQPAVGGVLVAGVQIPGGLPLDAIGMTGCFLHVDNVLTVLNAGPISATEASAPFAVPNNSGLIGLSLPLQGAAINGTFNGLGVASTNGLALNVDMN